LDSPSFPMRGDLARRRTRMWGHGPVVRRAGAGCCRYRPSTPRHRLLAGPGARGMAAPLTLNSTDTKTALPQNSASGPNGGSPSGIGSAPYRCASRRQTPSRSLGPPHFPAQPDPKCLPAGRSAVRAGLIPSRQPTSPRSLKLIPLAHFWAHASRTCAHSSSACAHHSRACAHYSCACAHSSSACAHHSRACAHYSCACAHFYSACAHARQKGCNARAS